jgi:uncharacterized protein (DUF39 family)
VPSTGNGGASVVIGAGGDVMVFGAVVAGSGPTMLVGGAVAVPVSAEPIDETTDDVVTELVDPPMSTDPVGDEPHATTATAERTGSRRIRTRWCTSCRTTEATAPVPCRRFAWSSVVIAGRRDARRSRAPAEELVKRRPLSLGAGDAHDSS